MKLQYMGSGSAEGVPAPFCACDNCRRIRQLRGHDIRRRSGLCVNDTVLIDFPPDIGASVLATGVDLSRVTDVLITHSHHDHLAITELFLRDPVEYCQVAPDAEPLRVWGNEGVKRVMDAIAPLETHGTDYLDYRPITHFDRFQVSGMEVTYLPARHKPNEKSGFYLLEDGRVRALYAHDTGVFLDETYAFLAGKPLDFISYDCNYGLRSVGVTGHMGWPEVQGVSARLRELGAVTDKTVQVVSHFSHFSRTIHAEMQAACEPEGFTVAYDGLIVQL